MKKEDAIKTNIYIVIRASADMGRDYFDVDDEILEKPCDEAMLRDITIYDQIFQEWTVEINDLNELNNFISKYGKVVIYPSNSKDYNLYPSLEPMILIYDNYIE